jgi:hypothetical protein
VTTDMVGRYGAIAAVLCGAAGLIFESTSMTVLGTVWALGSMVAWVRWTAPHDHWKEFRRRRD